MSSDQRRVAELVGVEESFLMRASQGLVSTASRSANVQKSIAIHRRFYTTLILHELVNEVPLPTVAAKYSCGFGQLQALQQSASTFSGMVTVFCSRLGWWNLELLLAQFKNRLNFGIQRELCDLVRISLLNAQRARLLYDAGYPTVAAVATCNPDDVETLLRNSVPFKSGRQVSGGQDVKQNKSQIKDKGAIPSRRDSAIALSREHPKRKNEQKDSGSPPKRQRTPPKAYPAVQEESVSAIAKGPAGVVLPSDSEHPERRTSDTGRLHPSNSSQDKTDYSKAFQRPLGHGSQRAKRDKHNNPVRRRLPKKDPSRFQKEHHPEH
eukprot:XP_011677466.1 PREDICTED: DNA polymerase theta [Strongylocentrotus purpuratus]